ncbi:MAG: IclR family transcriptional regulator [Sporomusaceae bacterium]|nr:IclR family transcriptional regulator [Sporomusaceae bacterium]
MPGDKQYVVASVDRALELLMLLSKSPRDMGITELSKLLNVHKSTVHSLLTTLAQRGFVRQTEASRYTLGLQLIKLGTICADRLDIRSASRPVMSQLAAETQAVVLLAMLSNEKVTIVEKIEPEQSFLLIPKFDFSITLHSTAVGKVLFASMPDHFVEAVLARGLARYTAQTITARDAMLAELAAVRSQGYAIGCNETIDGIACIAAPVYDAAGHTAAALSISSSSSTISAALRQQLIALVCGKAAAISSRLGYYGPAVV